MLVISVSLLLPSSCFCWGFFAHQKINNYAVFLLPPEMLGFYKKNIDFITAHAVDPDKRRYLIQAEASRHYIDIDRYGLYPYKDLPRNYDSALAKYSRDTLEAHGIVPWWTVIMLQRLTRAFKEKNAPSILKLSAELGHYIADAHVPLHASSNHNGQLTNQHGIHAFWESRIPELYADKEFDFFIGRAAYVKNASSSIWKIVLESAAAADTVLRSERELSQTYPNDQKFAFENRNGKMVRQYAEAFSGAYNRKLSGMVERRMRQSIFTVASFWYTAWVNAGQPDLRNLSGETLSDEQEKVSEQLNLAWKNAQNKGLDCDP